MDIMANEIDMPHKLSHSNSSLVEYVTGQIESKAIPKKIPFLGNLANQYYKDNISQKIFYSQYLRFESSDTFQKKLISKRSKGDVLLESLIGIVECEETNAVELKKKIQMGEPI